MNTRGNMCIQQILFYMANSRTFTNLILSLLIQRRIRIYYVDKITSVFGFPTLNSISKVCLVSDSVIRNYGSYRSSGIESSSQLNIHNGPLFSEHLETVFMVTLVENCSTQLNSNQSLAEVVILSVCSFVTMYAI